MEINFIIDWVDSNTLQLVKVSLVINKKGPHKHVSLIN